MKKDIDYVVRKKFHIHLSHDNPPYTGWLKDTKRTDIYDLFADLGYTYGAEIGVKRGINAKAMFERIPSLNLILVDPWGPYGKYTKERAESAYKIAQDNLKGRFATWMRMESLAAVKKIKNESLDFVYIDGLHDFNNVMMDIIRWVPKVKKGGIVAGHDYIAAARTGVVRAVDAYALAHGIRDVYLTRNLAESPSWFWVRNR